MKERRFVYLIVFDLSWAKGFILCIILPYQNLCRFWFWYPEPTQTISVCLDPDIVTCLNSRRIGMYKQVYIENKKDEAWDLGDRPWLGFGLIQDPIRTFALRFCWIWT